MSKKKSGYKVQDLVIDDEYSTIESNATVVEAAQKMKEKGVPDLVIIDQESKKILGIVADFDIVHEVVAMGKDPKTTNVKTAMYQIEPVKVDTPVEDAFLRMQNLKVTVVPVVEGDKLLGVCTIQDCWSYIPQEGVDRVGIIPVANSRLAEFWLGSICAIVAFIIGVVFPLVGLFGYFSADGSQLTELFHIVVVPGGSVTFYLFEAHSSLYFTNYAELAGQAGLLWGLVLFFSFALLITTIIGIFSIFYSGISNLRSIPVGKFHQRIFPLMTILFIAIEWVLIATVLGTATPAITTLQVDGIGLTCSIVAIALIVVATFRDYIFIQKPGGK